LHTWLEFLRRACGTNRASGTLQRRTSISSRLDLSNMQFRFKPRLTGLLRMGL
jgi:hypothetical protein